MDDINLTEEELTEICEDAFVCVKEACMRLQERTKCSNEVVIEMLNNVVDFYTSLKDETKENDFNDIAGQK